VPHSARSQSPVSPGTLSISLGLDSGTQAGIWLTATSSVRVGLLGTLERTRNSVDGPGDASTSSTRIRFAVGPALKWYVLSNTTPVSPFWYASASLGADDPPNDERTTSYGLVGGFGADWFPVPQVSFGGHTGLGFTYDRTRENGVTRTSSRLGTLTAGLQMHIYF
jgi:hypothetical protein